MATILAAAIVNPITTQGRPSTPHTAPGAASTRAGRAGRARPEKVPPPAVRGGLSAARAARPARRGRARSGGAVLLAGDSSVGKSVLLALLLARGWQMLSDDMAALSLGADGAVRVLPVSDELRLWPDADVRVEVVPTGRMVTEPVTISRVWILGLTNEPGVTITDITGATRFSALAMAAFNSRIAAALLDRRANLRVLGGLAGSHTPIRRLTRSRAGWTAEELAGIVASDAIDRADNSFSSSP